MTKPTKSPAISRRTLLLTASLVLLASAVRPLPPAALAAAPKLTYGHGYTGGY